MVFFHSSRKVLNTLRKFSFLQFYNMREYIEKFMEGESLPKVIFTVLLGMSNVSNAITFTLKS